MTVPEASLVEILGAFAEPGRRAGAAAALARQFRCDELFLLCRDPETAEWLPAPGLPPAAPDGAGWRGFLARCAAAADAARGSPDGVRQDAAELAETLPIGADGRAVSVRALADPAGVILVATGDDVVHAELTVLAPVLPLLGALFSHEGQVRSAAERLSAAARAVEVAGRAKSDFLATMSHELRTPVNAIIGYTEIMEMGISGRVTPEQRLQLERVRGSSRHLLTLINDVLDLAHIEAGQLTLDVRSARAAHAVADAVALVALQATERRITLLDECADSDATYAGDENRVRQIVVNLLSNAIKFTPPGGEVRVRCGNVAQPVVDARLTGAGPWTFIAVADTGIGMSREEIAHVFRPFVQVETGRTRASGGTGLGLTIGRQLALLMGGDLTVRSEPGAGSTFTLWLPATNARAGTLDDNIRVRAG